MDQEIRLSVNGKEFDRSVKIDDLLKIFNTSKIDPTLIKARFSNESDWYSASDFIHVYNARYNNINPDIINQYDTVSNLTRSTPPPIRKREAVPNPVINPLRINIKRRTGITVFVTVCLIIFTTVT